MQKVNLWVVEEKLADFFRKLPSLPNSVVSPLVDLLPYLAGGIGILTVINSGILNLLNLGWNPLSLANKAFFINYYMFIVFELIIGVILIMAYKPLLSRSAKGWRLLFYAALISFLPALILGLLGETVIILIMLYILFQIRENYK